MNLPIHQKNAIDLLPANAQVVVRARFESPIISEMPKAQALVEIMNLISLCIAESGQRVQNEAQAKAFLTERVYEDCCTHFKQVRLNELKIALNEGVRGNYGQYMGINITTINKWIKEFLVSEYRKTSLDYFNLLLTQQKAKVEPTPEERTKMLKNSCDEAYGAFLREGEMSGIASTLYIFMKKELNIKWTGLERKEIEDAANREFKMRLMEEGKFKINEGGDKLTTIQRKIALKYYFIKLKNNGRTSVFD